MKLSTPTVFDFASHLTVSQDMIRIHTRIGQVDALSAMHFQHRNIESEVDGEVINCTIFDLMTSIKPEFKGGLPYRKQFPNRKQSNQTR